MSDTGPSGSGFLPAIRRARIGRLDIYEVSESELLQLERGSLDSIFLNFAIFLISAAINLFVALVTTNIDSRRTFDVFVIVTTVSFVAG